MDLNRPIHKKCYITLSYLSLSLTHTQTHMHTHMRARTHTLSLSLYICLYLPTLLHAWLIALCSHFQLVVISVITPIMSFCWFCLPAEVIYWQNSWEQLVKSLKFLNDWQPWSKVFLANFLGKTDNWLGLFHNYLPGRAGVVLFSLKCRCVQW